MGGGGALLVVRFLLSLGAVLGLMAVVAWAMRRSRGGLGRRKTPAFEVLTMQPLGRNASLALVVTGGRALVLGIAQGSITLLAERDADELLQDTRPPGTGIDDQTGAPLGQGTWTGLLDQLRERTVRRA